MDHGYVVEVTSISHRATEKDIYDFFAFCGTIEHVDVVRASEDACTAYVTFRDAYSLETATLLSGATLLDQQICVAPWGQHEHGSDFWNQHYWSPEDGSNSNISRGNQFGYSPGEAVTVAQDIVKTMVSKGYMLSKDALSKAREFDESHQVSSSAAAKVAEMSERIGLTGKLCAGVETVKSIDQKFHVSDYTKSAVSATGRTASAAATTVVNSQYFSKGALWVSDVLSRASKAAADLGTHGISKEGE